MSVLDGIVARKRADVAERMADRPLSSFVGGLAPSHRSFADALSREGISFILECKRASPSEGLIRPDFDIDKIARAYAPFADAVSVLTDEPYFQGSAGYIPRVAAITGRPVLCKDFVVSPYQVYEARLHGADAILLMLSVLDDTDYAACAQTAKRLSMDVLTEVHDEEELGRAVALGAKIIGINNRDLRTLKVNLDTTRRLAPQVPKGRIVVSESGIRSRADVEALAGFVDAFLVGGSLMKEERLDLAVRRLIFGRVKICGLSSREDAAVAYESGASYGGLIFAEGSARKIGEKNARIVAEDTRLPLVGVCVNEKMECIARLARDLGLAAVQLHGDEDAEYIAKARNMLPDTCEIWKAMPVWGAQKTLPALLPWADRLLLDTHDASARGGTGRVFDWHLLDSCTDRSRIAIAGGIGPGNVREAIALGCFAVDVNSGVERERGKKDHEKIAGLFDMIRGRI